MSKIRFERREVMAFLNEHYPSCSSYYKQKIAFRTSRRRWNDVTIGKAVGITVTNYVRHHMTQYEYLMGALKLTREEARIVVAEEVKDIWQSWQQPRLDTTPADDASAVPTDQ